MAPNWCVLVRRGPSHRLVSLFFFNDTATTEIYTLSLHDALPICGTEPVRRVGHIRGQVGVPAGQVLAPRSEEHTSELQSPDHLVCRLLLEKKKKEIRDMTATVIADTKAHHASTLRRHSRRTKHTG